MKINSITTIVDLAFNLSGSLAGIPVILSQLPASEKIGFDALPEIWEDVEDIGQTWAPNLAGLDIEVQIESYNALAVNKAPYSTDMKCIDVASEWGNALLDVLESGDWYSIANIPTDIPFVRVERTRVFGFPESIDIKVPAYPTEALSYTFVPPTGTSVRQYLNFKSDSFRLLYTDVRRDGVAVPVDQRSMVRGEYSSPLNLESDIAHVPKPDWLVSGEELQRGWRDILINAAVSSIIKNSDGAQYLNPPTTDYRGWTIRDSVFIKLIK